MKSIYICEKFNSDLDRRGKIYVALNLMTLANIQKFHNERNIYWVDGLFGKLFCMFKGLKVKKKPGRELLRILLNHCDKFVLFGNLSGSKSIDSRVKKHFPLKNYAIDVLKINFADVRDNIVVISLPSPLQEELSKMICPSNSVFCIGGALSMLANEKYIPPKLFSFLGIEFIWRLRFDTKRRVHRLITSFSQFFLNVRVLSKYKVFRLLEIN